MVVRPGLAFPTFDASRFSELTVERTQFGLDMLVVKVFALPVAVFNPLVVVKANYILIQLLTHLRVVSQDLRGQIGFSLLL